MKKSISTRLTAAVGALALGILGAVAITAPASATEPVGPGPNLKPGDKGTITIHKHEQPTVPGDPASGEDQGILPNPIQGVVFSVTPVTDVDLLTNTGWDEAADLSEGLAAASDPAAYITANLTLGAAQNLAATDAQGVAKSNQLPIGLYLVREVSGPASIVSKAAPFLVTVPLPPLTAGGDWNYNIHVYPKNAVVKTPEKAVDQSKAFALGQTVTWTVTATIPSFESGSDLKSYKVTDNLDSRLSYTAPARVFVNNVAVPANAVTISATNPVTVTFTDPAGLDLLRANGGKTVKVEIDTVVTGTGAILNTAVVNVNGSDFTTNPAKTTWVPVKVTKVDADDSKIALAGAVFAVYTQKEGGTALPFPNNASGQFTTDASGAIAIPGLKADGTQQYWLQEVSAPNGYQALTERVPLAVDANGNAIALPGADAGTVVTYERTVKNTRIPVWELPLTGGDGALWFGVGGAALVAITVGAAVLISRRAKANA